MTKIDSKQCTKCEEMKKHTEFDGNSKAKDGLQAYCKPCNKRYYEARKGSIVQKASWAVRRARQKAKKSGAVDTLTLAEVTEVLAADHCDYCDKEVAQSEKTLEHVIPFEYGGENTFGNVTLACAACNSKKHDLPAFEFILLNGDANAARRLLNVLAERNGMEPQEYLYKLAQAGIQYRTERLRRRFGADAQ